MATPIGDGTVPHPITAWFRHSFSLTDPSLYHSLWLRLRADDGAVVYLNGEEIHRARLPAGVPVTPKTPASVEVEGLNEELYSAVDIARALPLLRKGLNVLAVEVHQFASSSLDLSFDAEIGGNLSSTRFPPQVAFTSPSNGSLHLLGRPILLLAQAADPDGPIEFVSYFADGQMLGLSKLPPYKVSWDNAPAGEHQIIARATDSEGNVGEAYLTVRVLVNLPPLVDITSPENYSTFAPSDRITVVAAATDVGGSVERVDFYRKEHMHSFNEPEVLIGSRTAAPYSVDMTKLEPGHYFLFAEATDNKGATTRSGAVMIEVMNAAGPRLTIEFMISHVMITRPVGSTLQQASQPTGPWQDLPNAANPTMIIPQGKGTFYRAYFP